MATNEKDLKMDKKDIKPFSAATLGFPEDPKDHLGRVKSVMACACELLINYREEGYGPPTKELGIIIHCNSKEERGLYLWTALMVLGEKTPNMKFGHESLTLRVNSMNAVIQKQRGIFWSRFSSQSLYETVFKNHLTEDMFDIDNYPKIYKEEIRRAEEASQQKAQLLEERKLLEERREARRQTEERKRQEARQAQRQEEANRQAEERAQQARRQEEARRRAEERAQEAQRQEEARQQERAQEAQRQEEARQQERAQEDRRQEEARQQERAQEARRQEEASRQAEERAQEARRQEEARRIEEARRQAEESSKRLIYSIKNSEYNLSVLVVIDLLKAGADINYRDEHNRTSLIYALLRQNDPVVNYLLSRYPDTTIPDNDGLRAIDLVPRDSSLFKRFTQEIYEKVLNEIPPGLERSSVELKNLVLSSDVTIERIGNYTSKKIINHINFQDATTKYTPLMHAIHANNYHVAEFLLNHGANPLIRNSRNELASDLVPSNSHLYTLLKEKEKEMQLNDLPESIRYSTILHEYVQCSDAKAQKIAEYIDLGANINYQDLKGYSVLMVAVDAQNERIAEYLLKRGANALLRNNLNEKASDLVSSTSTLFSLLKNQEKILESIHQPNHLKYNQLLHDHLRSSEVKIETIEQFLQAGADINYQDINGISALMIVLDSENERIAKYLLNNGANPTLKNNTGNTARSFISRNSPIYPIIKGYELIFSTIAKDLPAIKLLLQSDLSLLNFQGPGGYSALLIAVEQNMLFIVEYLLSLNASLILTCDDGKGVWELVNDEGSKYLLVNKNTTFEESTATSSESSLDRHGFFGSSDNDTTEQNEIIPSTSACNE